MTARMLPYAFEAERAVLGGLLLDPGAFDRIATLVAEPDFGRRDHALVFRGIATLAAQGIPPDALTLMDWFEAQGIAEMVGGRAGILALADETPSAANITAYAAIVRDRATLRRTIDRATAILDACFDAGDRKAADIVDESIRDLMALSKASARHEYTLGQVVGMVHAEMADAHANGPKVGISTGIKMLDKHTGGYHPGELAIIGARPKMGKTAALMTSADAAIASGLPVGIISAEESALQTGRRMVSGRTGISAAALRACEIEEHKWARLTDAVAMLGSARAWVYDEPAPTVERVASVARRWKKEHGIRILYVDYIQRLTLGRAGRNMAKHEIVGAIARELSILARDLEIPVVSGAQVSREVEKRKDDKRPSMGDLSDSSEIEKEAACIVMLYRDEVYHPTTTTEPGIAELRIEANRWGPPGFVKAAWLGERMRFADLAHGPWERAA